MSLPPRPPWLNGPEPEPTPVPAEVVSPAPPKPPRRWLPWVLFSATFVTTLIAGGNLSANGAQALEYAFSGGTAALFQGVVFFLWAGLPYSLALMGFFLAHEMGHYLACRYYRIEATLPFFIPTPPPLLIGTLGAVIRIKGPIPHRRALFDMGIAGPLAGFVVAFPVLMIGVLGAQASPPGPVSPGGLIMGDSLLTKLLFHFLRPDLRGVDPMVGPVFVAGWIGLLATTMNLIPSGQLDGGHIFYALFPKHHRRAGLMAAGFLFGIIGMRAIWFHEISTWILWAVVVFLFSRHHPPVPGFHEPLGTRRIVLAVLAAVILLLCFMPHPLSANL